MIAAVRGVKELGGIRLPTWAAGVEDPTVKAACEACTDGVESSPVCGCSVLPMLKGKWAPTPYPPIFSCNSEVSAREVVYFTVVVWWFTMPKPAFLLF